MLSGLEGGRKVRFPELNGISELFENGPDLIKLWQKVCYDQLSILWQYERSKIKYRFLVISIMKHCTSKMVLQNRVVISRSALNCEIG